MDIGYAHISTGELLLDLQRNAVTMGRRESIVTDTLNRAKTSHPGGRQLDRSIVDTVAVGCAASIPMRPFLQELHLRG